LYYEKHRTMNEEIKNLPTNSELEILHILWEHGSATVREVYEGLKPERETGYTTTLKTMQIMTEKGMLCRDTSSRKHIYKPLITRERTQKHFLNKMIDGLFSGSASSLVIGALGNQKLSVDDILEIREYLEQFENNTP
jgi:BlaI family transcriptional regulator, penicillinase repressor